MPPIADQQSRLSRATNAPLSRYEEVEEFLEREGIPFSTAFRARVLSTPALQKAFDKAYGQYELPPTGLPQSGASTALVFEYGNRKYYNHGQAVASIADQVASTLQPGVRTVHVEAPLNLHYNVKSFSNEMVDGLRRLIENQGVPVLHTSISWADHDLSFRGGFEQLEHLWNVTAFVVHSTGNDGGKWQDGVSPPQQGHDGIAHFPPLVVSVGACSKNKDDLWAIDGYSSANGPTFVAPVASMTQIEWWQNAKPTSIQGTSAAAPYVSGMLTALNARYGAYLTREQILTAVIATCWPLNYVRPFENKTEEDGVTLQYAPNAAGLPFNPSYGGFGCVKPDKADKLCAQLVHLTQQESSRITVPVEDRVQYDALQDAETKRDAAGNYVYTIDMPPGIALKTTLAVEFENTHGTVQLVSPSGTALPMVMSKLNSTSDSFGLCTTHGFTNEDLGGSWQVVSSTPIRRMQLNQHHFLENDIVKDLTPGRVEELLNLPYPDLSEAAIPPFMQNKTELRPRDATRRLRIAGQPLSHAGVRSIIGQLRNLPSGFEQRNRRHTLIQYAESLSDGSLGAEKENLAYSYANKLSAKGVNPADCDAMVDAYLAASQAYGQSLEDEKAKETPDSQVLALESLRHCNTLSMAGKVYLHQKNLPAEGELARMEKSISILRRAIATAQQYGFANIAYSDADALYSACGRAAQACRENDPVRAREFEYAMAESRRETRRLYLEEQGGADPSAHRIEEGEYGFSDNARIGTDNINQCIVIIARDPITHKTGLAHINYITDVHSLEQFFSKFDPEHRLEIRVVGSRKKGDDRTLKNIFNVMNYLTDKNADIISADVFDGNTGPGAVVVDPLTGKIEERVPTLPSQRSAAFNVTLPFAKGGRPLSEQFDFTQSDTIQPVLFTQQILKVLRGNWKGKSEIELDARYSKFGFADRAMHIQRILDTLSEYKYVYGDLRAHLNAKITAEGLSKKEAKLAVKALRKQPIFLGDNSQTANAPLLEWIDKRLIVDGAVVPEAIEENVLHDAAEREKPAIPSPDDMQSGWVDKVRERATLHSLNQPKSDRPR